MTRGRKHIGNSSSVSRRDLLRMTGAVGAAAALSGCSGTGDQNGATDDSPADQETDAESNDQQDSQSGNPQQLNIAPATGPTTLDPHNHRETTTATVLVHFYDGLVSRNDDMELVPQLAESWENVDPTTWTFTLREGVAFSDGEEFTGETVKYNLERVSGQLEGSDSLPIVDQYSSIDTIDVKDDYNVQVNLKNPDPLFLESQAELLYVPQTFTEENGFDELNNDPVGTGPYTLEEWVRDDHLTMAAKSSYWGGEPSLDTVQWRPMPEPSSRLASLLNNDVHLIRSAEPRSVERINSNDGTSAKSTRSARSAALWLNLEQSMEGRDGPLFYEQPKLRKAVNYAINVDGIIENILGGYGTRSSGWAPSEQFLGHNSDIEPYPYDPDRARQLLQEAGYEDGFEARLLVPRGRYFKGVSSAEAIATMLGDVGIDLELNIVEFGQFAELTQQHKMPEFMFAAWGNSTFNALDAYVPLVKSDSLFSLLPDEDKPEWVNSVDEKITKAQSTADREKLDGLLQELEATIHEQAAFVFLYQYEDLYGVNDSFDWEPRADELMYVANSTLNN